MNNINREQWLTQSADLIWHELVSLHTLNPKPNYKFSMSKLAPKVLAECNPIEPSKGSYNEIFVAAHTDNSIEILAALVHEIIHASDNCESGHRNYFAKVARQCGLESRLTATTPSKELTQHLQTIVDLLGEIPHSALTIKPKQKGRNNNKIQCQDCGFQANLSAKWATRVMASFRCPCCTSCNTNTITK